MARQEHTGICHICGEYKKLTYEHIPPEAAFNIMGIADMFLIGFVFSHGKSPFLRLWERAAALLAVAP